MPNTLDISKEELKTFQEKDETLERPRMIANGQQSAAAGENFFLQDGMLYRRYQPPGSISESQVVDQLVLPTRCRNAVLKLAHDIPMAGHLGKAKTTDRILQRFYWPGVYCDVKQYCKECERCQKSSPRGVKKAPMIPLPIMEEPFKRIAMDVVGPLPRSSSRKRFILVICDYATRYPEAVPL